MLRTLVFSSMLLVVLAPLASADEGAADCEPGQPYVGYRNTDLARAIVQGATSGVASLALCEGEQWDGEDAVQPGEPSACPGPRVDVDPSALSTNVCLGEDVNDAPGSDPLNPVGVRASTANLQEAYVSANVALVARGALYVGTCGADDPGLEGAASCAGTRELRTGLYARDNTPGNIIATAVTCLIRIICYVSENDCSYETYVYGMYHPPSECGRDNTALGFGVILP